MRLKLNGNPTPAESTVACYLRMANVALGSDNPEEQVVGSAIEDVIEGAIEDGDNATDRVMQSLAAFDKATRRMREELRGIHS